MRIRARCLHCEREFWFLQLSNADPDVADRCPHCARRLATRRLGPLSTTADRALTILVNALDEIGRASPNFVVLPSSIFEPITDALPNGAGSHQTPAGVPVMSHSPRPAAEPLTDRVIRNLRAQLRAARRTFSEPAVAFAAAACVAPLAVILALTGSANSASLGYTLAVIMFAAGVTGFVASSLWAWVHRHQLARAATVLQASEQYLAARGPALARASQRELRRTLAGFCRSVDPQLPVYRLRRRHVEKWLRSLDSTPATVRHKLSGVKGFTRWLVAHRYYLRKDPCAGLRPPRVGQSLPRELDAEQVAKLLTAVPDPRGELIVLLMVMEGLRREEVARLDVADIDWKDRLLLVHGKGRTERALPVSVDTWATLEKYRRACPASYGPLIRSNTHSNRGLTPGRIGQLVVQWMTDAGVKARPHDGRSAHALRHTFAGALLDDGANLRDVQDALGHAHLGPTYAYLKRRQPSRRLREVMGHRSYRLAPSRVSPG